MSTAATTVPSVAAPAPRSDFPTWLPAMLVKELRQGLRTRGFVLAFVVFQVLMALLMLGAVIGNDAATPGARAGTTTAVNGFFWTLITVQLLIVTPSRAAGSLQREIEARSLDLLLLTRLSAWRVVVGKWASLIAQSLLLLIAMLPYGIVRYFAGSADLVGDAGICLALLGGCAILTAAGLWSAGMSKIVRGFLAIVGISTSSGIWRAVATGFPGFSGFPTHGLDLALVYFDGALALLFFLVAAVRRIAPPAENHAMLARLLPLAAFLPVPAWALAGRTSVVSGQFAFACCFMLLVCATELGTVRQPMAVHLRPWLRRGGFGRFGGRFLLPGWPSALLFTVVAIALPTVGVRFVAVMPASDVIRIEWLAVLALGGLAFPVVALSFAGRKAWRVAGSLYGLVLGTMSAFAAVAAALASGLPEKYGWMQDFARVLPVSSFWLSLAHQELTDTTMVLQGALTIAVLGGAWWKAQPYWQNLALLESRERLARLETASRQAPGERTANP